MLYLVGSIILTAYLLLSFKICEKFKVQIFPAIVINYATCVITGSLFSGNFPIHSGNFHQSWFGWAMMMGGLFISLFFLIGYTTQKNGVSVASVANKLALVIPVIISVVFYKESFGVLKLAGILIAILAVYFTASNAEQHRSSLSIQNFLWPFILFIGSGLLDALINHVQKNYLEDQNQNDYLISGFFSAASIGIVIVLFGVVTKKITIQWKEVIAGICIGIPNYFSIWCLVKFLKANIWQSSAAIPLNNLGIVLFSTFVSYLFLKERMSTKNWTGIALAVVAILLIAFSD